MTQLKEHFQIPYDYDFTFLSLSSPAHEAADIGVEECERLSEESTNITQPQHEDGQTKHSVAYRGNLTPSCFRSNVSIS